MAHGAATQPKCRTCGERHLMGPCPFSQSTKRRLAAQTEDVSQEGAPVSRPDPPVSQKSVASDPAPVVVSHNVSQTSTYRYRDVERRRVYMRDWMRRKRAG